MAEASHTAAANEVLTRHAGIELTVALGKAHIGDDYDNADVYGRIKHFGGAGWQAQRFQEHPEVFETKINDQIERLRDIIAPHIGKLAAAKHRHIGVEKGGSWELWRRAPGDQEVMHTRGIILGIAGIAMKRTMMYDWEHHGDPAKVINMAWQGGTYKIGVLLDTSDNHREFGFRVQAPDTDRMLVPVRGLPRHRDNYSGLWSWQISGQ